jgi:hypothetical protein
MDEFGLTRFVYYLMNLKNEFCLYLELEGIPTIGLRKER